jgi:predicted alpha/beta hydrolase family esterase
MPQHPVILVHGYSAASTVFTAWRAKLEALGVAATSVQVADWRSLANELRLADLAEGFERALLARRDIPSDAPLRIVAHSAGALVVRAWLAAHPEQRARVTHFVGLGPAHFGSPLAHKGRSFVGMVAKGNRRLGEDFLEVGQGVLDALELASPISWELAHHDLLRADLAHPVARWSYSIAGTGTLSWPVPQLNDAAGGDGVVRWAGSALDTRKLTVDLSRHGGERVRIDGLRARDVPLAFVPQRNHGELVSRPTGDLAAMVAEALAVQSRADDDAWRARWVGPHVPRDAWQQLIVRVRDERGAPVPDHHLEFEATDRAGVRTRLVHVASDVHRNRQDPSYRAFHVRLRDVKRSTIAALALKVLARSGSSAVRYRGVGSSRADGWDGAIDLTAQWPDGGVQLFWPFTTTLLELVLDREPHPFEGENRVVKIRGASGEK